jgi:hypothetical protein
LNYIYGEPPKRTSGKNLRSMMRYLCPAEIGSRQHMQPN